MNARLSALGLGTLARRLLGVRLGRLRQYPPQALPLAQADIARTDRQHLPRISLVTPSLNQARYVGRTLHSVLSQDYPDLDYIVQDGGSRDGSADVIAAFAGAQLTIRSEPDSGQADALNKGFARSTGTVMGYLNSDDLLLPGTLLRVGRHFRDHPEVDVIYGNRLIVDEDDREIGTWVLPGHDAELIRHIDYVPQETLFWRRRIWERTGAAFDPDLHFALDWDLILRFVEAGAVIHHLPDLFGVFRVHGSQKTQADFLSRGAAEMSALRSRHRAAGGRLEGMIRHGRFLCRHRTADALYRRARAGTA